MLNLQSNALKFTETGSVTINVEIEEYIGEGSFLTISVIDTGIGIKEEDKDKLFKMFGYIEDKGRMNVHGIGLGLNLSKKIIEQFDGKIEVDSKFGKGSTFRFILKLYNLSEILNLKDSKP